jgi:hypothetical protein
LRPDAPVEDDGDFIALRMRASNLDRLGQTVLDTDIESVAQPLADGTNDQLVPGGLIDR